VSLVCCWFLLLTQTIVKTHEITGQASLFYSFQRFFPDLCILKGPHFKVLQAVRMARRDGVHLNSTSLSEGQTLSQCSSIATGETEASRTLPVFIIGCTIFLSRASTSLLLSPAVTQPFSC